MVLPDGDSTYTVLAADGLSPGPVEEFLEFLRRTSAPNTVRAYVQGLACWWTVLEDTGAEWDTFTLPLYTGFIDFLRSGRLPSVDAIGESTSWLAPPTVEVRSAAVLSLYRFHAAMGRERPMQVLYSSKPARRGAGYIRELAGVATGGPRPRYRLMKSRTRRHQPPTLTPTQVERILDICARPAQAEWTGNLRNRLYFATLAETGARRGEVLALKNCDWVLGRGATPFIQIVPRDDHPGGLPVQPPSDRVVTRVQPTSLVTTARWPAPRRCGAGTLLGGSGADVTGGAADIVAG